MNDASGAPRTIAGIYALISHGANGHGAFTSNGVAVNAGSVNADEQTNCHCTSAGTFAGTYAPTYVEKVPMQDTSNALDNFDDIVTFKEAWQMQTPDFPLAFATSKNSSPPAAVIAVIGIQSSAWVARNYPLVFSGGVLSFLPYSTIPSPPVGSVSGPYYTWSYDDNYVAALVDPGLYTSGLVVYRVSGTHFAPAFTLTAAGINAVAWSHNGQYLAVANGSAPSYVVVYKHCGTSFTALSTPAWIATPTQIQWTLDDQYLVAGAYSYGNLYKRAGDTISIVPATTLFMDGMPYQHYYFSPDGVYAAAPTISGGAELGVSSSPIQIYKKSGNQYAPLKQISPTAVGGNYQLIAWSPNTRYLAIAQPGNPSYPATPNLNIFSVTEASDTFTLLANPSQPGHPSDMSWSSNSRYLGIAGSNTGYTSTGNFPVTVYLNNQDGTFTPQTPIVPPTADFETGCGGPGAAYCYFNSDIFSFSN